MENIDSGHAQPADSDSLVSSRWDRRFLFLALGLFVWRILFLAISPLDLSPDEAYYWDWSRSLDWGYYSKPPMIAWVNALSSRLIGASAFGVRFPAAVFGTLSLVFLYMAARRVFDARTAFWAAAAASASVGVCAASFIMTIDAPLLFFWSAALYTSWRAMRSPEGGVLWWILTGILMGLGALSKQMMLVFPLLIGVFFLLPSDERPVCRKKGLLIATLIMIVFLLPVLYWNFEHGWITFRHTTHHFEGHHRAGLFFIKTFSNFIGSQAALMTPITWFLFVTISGYSLVNIRRLPHPARFAVLFGGFLFVFFLLMSFRQRIHGNWPAVCYLSGVITVAAWYTGRFSCGRRIDRLRRLFLPGIGLGACFAVMTYMLPIAFPSTGLGGNDPAARLRGWKQMAQEIDRILSDLPRKESTFVLTSKRQMASELAFYLSGRPRVYLWNTGGSGVASQYDLWQGPEQKVGHDSVIVLEGGGKPDEGLTSSFRSVKHLETIGVDKIRGGRWSVEVYLGETLLRWHR